MATAGPFRSAAKTEGGFLFDPVHAGVDSEHHGGHPRDQSEHGTDQHDGERQGTAADHDPSLR